LKAPDRPDIGSAGWILPIDPLLNVMSAPERWAIPLARLRAPTRSTISAAGWCRGG